MSTEPLIGYSHLHASGVRTFNLLISFSEGANHAVEEISNRISLTVIKSNIKEDDLSKITHFTEEVLPALLSHPHVAGAYIIGTGDESIPLYRIINNLLAINPATEYITINNGTDEEMAVTIATAGATDLSTQSLPGLKEIDSPKVILGYRNTPEVLTALLAQAHIYGIGIDVREFSSDPYGDLQKWMLEGTHVILSYIPEDMYPIGTILTPVINVSSGSDFHLSFAGDFDLQSSDSAERVLEELLGVFSRVRTFSEYTRTSIPLMSVPPRAPELAKRIQLVIANEALEILAKDVADHFDDVDFLGSINDASNAFQNLDRLVVLTTGSATEKLLLANAPSGWQIISLSEAGSLGALAQAAAEFITAQK